MPRVANKFEDPKLATVFEWPVNHSDEEEEGPERSVENGANTAGTGLNPIQADDQPIVKTYEGTIFSKAQFTQMIAWYNLCKTQTINFHDFAGDSYEVLITSFKYQRKRTIKNPRDFKNAPLWYWKYTITLRVVRVIDGPLTGVIV